MKKIMIAAAIVCAAVMSQAAALAWSSVAVDGEGNEFTGGQAYLIMVTDAANFAVADNLTITGGSIVNSATIDASMATGEWSTESLTGGEVYNFAVLLTTEGKVGTTMPTTGFYGVDMNGDNATPFYQVTWDASTGGAFEPNFEGDYATYMSTAVVPEPTSGLLLLLGMAGLALRRKQA
jgi:hypothetical protein